MNKDFRDPCIFQKCLYTIYNKMRTIKLKSSLYMHWKVEIPSYLMHTSDVPISKKSPIRFPIRSLIFMYFKKKNGFVVGVGMGGIFWRSSGPQWTHSNRFCSDGNYFAEKLSLPPVHKGLVCSLFETPRRMFRVLWYDLYNLVMALLEYLVHNWAVYMGEQKDWNKVNFTSKVHI